MMSEDRFKMRLPSRRMLSVKRKGGERTLAKFAVVSQFEFLKIEILKASSSRRVARKSEPLSTPAMCRSKP